MIGFINAPAKFKIKGTNHQVVLLDGDAEANGLKYRAAFDALPNDNTPYNLMCLGGSIDYLPNVSLRRYTTFGSIDSSNPLVVISSVNCYSMDNINLLNMRFNSDVLVDDSVRNSNFENVVFDYFYAQNGNFNNCKFKNIFTSQILCRNTDSVTFENSEVTFQVNETANKLVFSYCKINAAFINEHDSALLYNFCIYN